jgi:hypothetical protein
MSIDLTGFPSDYANLLAQLNPPEVAGKSTIKKATVGQIEEAKRANAASTADQKKVAIGGIEGNGQSEVERDLQFMSPVEIALKYGPDVALGSSGVKDQASVYKREERGTRTRGEIAADSALGLTAGTLGGLGGIASFGAGVFSDDAGAAVSRWTEAATGSLRDSQSTTLKRDKANAAIRSQLDDEDNQKQYQQDLLENKPYAGLRRFGREALNTAEDLWNNPELAGDLVAEGIGSFIASGGLAKVGASAGIKLVMAQKGASPAAIERFLASSAGKKMVQELNVKLQPATIGLLEGGGAYSSTQNQIQAMSFADLEAGSEEFRNLVAAGMSPEEAKSRIANQAALQAGGMQGVTGAFIGKGVAKFEANPLGFSSSKSFRQSLRELGDGVLKETTEEAIQSGTADVFTNLAIQQNADDSRELTKDVAGNMVKGAVAGAGMAGVLRAPDVTIGSAARAVAPLAQAGLSALGKGANAVSSTISNAVNKVQEGKEPTAEEVNAARNTASVSLSNLAQAASAALDAQRNAQPIITAPNTTTTTTAAGAAAAEAVVVEPVTVKGVTWIGQSETAIALSNGEFLELPGRLSREEAEAAVAEYNAKNVAATAAPAKSFMERQTEMLQVSAAEINNYSPTLKEIIGMDPDQVVPEGKAFDRLGVMGNLEEALASGQMDRAQEVEAMLWLNDMRQKFDSVPDAEFDSVQLDPNVKQNLSAMREQGKQALQVVFASKVYKNLEAKLAEVTQDDLGPMPEINAQTANTPEVKQAVEKTVRLAAANPAGTNEGVINLILNQKDIIGLTSKDVQQLRAAQSLVSVGNKAAAAKADNLRQTKKDLNLAEQDEIDEVGDEVPVSVNTVRSDLTTGRTKTGPNQLSMNDHVKRIMGAVSSGNLVQAKKFAQIYRNLAEHMQNKVAALNESAKNQNRANSNVSFRTWTGERWIDVNEKGATNVGVRLNRPGSIKFAKDVEIDAQAVANNFNQMIEIYGEQLGVEPIQATQLDFLQKEESGETNLTSENASTKDGTIKPAKENAVSETKTKPSDVKIQEEQKAVNELNANVSRGKFTRMDQKDQVRVRRSIKTIEKKIGFAILARINRVVAITDESDIAGWAQWDQGFLGLKSSVFNNLRTKRARHILTHEVAHFIDSIMGNGKVLRSVMDGRLSSKNKGDLYLEISELIKKDELYKKFFFSALDQSSDSEKSQELFAQVAALVIRNRTKAAEVLPNATQYIEELFAEARGRVASGDGEAVSRRSQEDAGRGGDQQQDAAGADVDGQRVRENVGEGRQGESGPGGRTSGNTGRLPSDRVRIVGEVQLPLSGKDVVDTYRKKDQKKANQATVFIGIGSPRSSTNAYRMAFGDKANTGKYFSDDVVFVSAEGGAPGRVAVDDKTANGRKILSELKLAIEAGATIITDKADARERAYNVGEREVAAFLAANGYVESKPGIWRPQTSTATLDAMLVEESQPVEDMTFENVMKDKKGVNRLTRAYTFSVEKSRLIGQSRPIRFFMDFLRNKTKIEGLEIVPLGSKTQKAVEDYVSTYGPILVQKLNENLLLPSQILSEELGDSKGSVAIRPIDALTSDKDFLSYRMPKGLALLDPRTQKYDQRLIESAVLAALYWVLVTNNVNKTSYKDISKSFGVEVLSPAMIEAAQNGTAVDTARDNLAREIKAFWGVTNNRSVTDSDVNGIADAIAAEILLAMDGVLIEKVDFAYKNDDGEPRNARNIKVGRDADHRKELLEVRRGKRVIKELAVVDGEVERYIDKEPKPVTKGNKQKRNPVGTTSGKANAALNNLQKIKHKRNTPLLGFLNFLGKELYLELRGYRKFEPGQLNKIDKLTVEGKNQQLEYSWDNVQEHDAEVLLVAEATNKTPEEVITRHDFYAGSNSRMMAKGFSFQGDKFMREAYPSTVWPMDLTGDNEKDLERFWMSVVQSLGIKPEKGNRADNILRAKKRVKENYSATIDVMVAYLNNNSEGMSDDMLFLMKSELGTNVSDKKLHALMAVAQYFSMLSNDDFDSLKEFNHMLAFEADGKTDGLINALLHYVGSAFTQTYLNALEMGGIFINSVGKTLNDVVLGDLYELGTKHLNAIMKVQEEALRGTEAFDHHQAMMDLMTDMSLRKNKDGEPEYFFTREYMKNPMMIDGYGSSENGIAGNIAAEIQSFFYRQMSEAAKGKYTMPEKYRKLFTIRFERDRSGEIKKLVAFKVGEDENGNPKFERPNLSKMNDHKNFEFDFYSQKSLAQNVKFFLVEPTAAAIAMINGEAKTTLDAVQKFTQVQGILLQARFEHAVRKKIEARVKEGKLDNVSQLLSQDDLQEVYDELSRFGAIIEPIDSNTNTVNVTGLEKTRGWDRSASDFSGAMGGRVKSSTPKQPGVAIAPMLTISRGDAQIMANYYSNKAMDEMGLATMEVYDGLEMAAALMEMLSERINQAAIEMMLENPMMDVADSFTDFIRNNGLNDPFFLESVFTDPGYIAQVEKLLGPYIPANAENFVAFAMNANKFVQNKAIEIQANKNVLARVRLTVDKMAGAQSPAFKDGEVIEGDLITGLNELRTQELNKLLMQKELNETRDTVQKPDPEFVKRIQEYGAPVKEPIRRISERGETIQNYNLTQLKAPTLIKMMSRTFMSKDHKMLVKALETVLPDYTFVFGSKNDLINYRNDLYKRQGLAAPRAGMGLGQIDNITQTIYISNQAPETVLHEMVHAALMNKILNYYQNPNSVSATDQKAMRNLEELMKEFIKMTFDADALPLREAALTAQHQIMEGLNERDQATNEVDRIKGETKAIQEFLAWTLTNQNLINGLKKSKVRVKLERFAANVLNYVKDLFGLHRAAKLDFLSNIRLNTAVLLTGLEDSSPDVSSNMSVGMVLNQIGGIPTDPRLRDLETKYDAKITHRLRQLQLDQERQLRQTAKQDTRIDPKPLLDEVDRVEKVIRNYNNSNNPAKNESYRALNILISNGFDFTPEEASLFKKMHVAFNIAADMDSVAVVRLQKVMTHVTKNLKLDKFTNTMLSFGDIKDVKNRSTMMATFLALSQTNEQLRTAMNKMTLPKEFENTEVTGDKSSLDVWLENTADSLIDRIASNINGTSVRNMNTLQTIDVLAQALGDIERDERTEIERKLDTLIDGAENTTKQYISKAGDRLLTALESVEIQDNESKAERIKVGIAKSTAALVASFKKGEDKAVGETVTNFTNKVASSEDGKYSTLSAVLAPIREVIDEAMGIQDFKEGVYMLMNKAKFQVSRMRQQYRDTTKEALEEQFSRVITPEERAAMFKGFGKADAVILLERYKIADVRRMYAEESYLQSEINSIQEELNKRSTSASVWFKKADDLAEFMINSKVAKDNDLRTNAELIAQLVDKTTGETVSLIDVLVTMLAIQKLSVQEKALMEKLVKTEVNGVDAVLNVMKDVRKKEMDKTVRGRGRVNRLKGYIPSEKKTGVVLKVAPLAEKDKYERLGFTFMGEYEGVDEGPDSQKLAYYYSTVSGDETYHQGIMQTVERSYMGVDPRTGRRLGGITAGGIYGPEAKMLEQQINYANAHNAMIKTKEPLIPLFNSNYEIYAYERSIDPEMLAKTRPNQDIFEMVGAWRGRQAEEHLSQEINESLVDELHRIYENKSGMQTFINLAKPTGNPVWDEVWKRVPRESKEYIKKKFGKKDEFFVPMDMINNVGGYRDPSIAEFWKGGNNLNRKLQDTLVQLAEIPMGKNAYKYLVTAEKAIKAGVSVAKQIIVTKSIIVPLLNIMSNDFWLLTKNVPVRTIYNAKKKKLVEIGAYQKAQKRIDKIDLAMAQYRDDPVKIRQLKLERRSLEDANKRLSIWPMIEAGEFNTVSEGFTDVDAAISEGRLAEWMKGIIEKVPAKAGTVGKNMFMTQDTALYKGMSRMVQYGDFLAKSILYDHMVQQEERSESEGRRIASEAFVSYNFLPGRTRTLLDSLGLTWFMHYKIRILKESFRAIKESPLRSLLSMSGGSVVDVGSPFSDNIVSKTIDGSLSWSLGMGQGLNAPFLLPVAQLGSAAL